MMKRLAVLILLLLSPVASPAEDNPLDPAGASAAVRRAVFRAEAAHGRDETNEAVRLLEETLAGGENRAHPSLLYRLGAYLMELGRIEDAFGHLERSAELAPDAEAAWLDYARAAFETGRHETAAGAFSRAYSIQVAAMREHHGEHEDHEDHDHETHIDFVFDGHDHHDVDPRLMYYSAMSWLLADRPHEAVDILAPLTAAVPDTVPRAWVQALVSAAASCEEPERADRAVERLLENHPDAPDVWILASQQAQIRENLSDAALHLQVADWILPLPARDLRRLAELYGAAGVPRQAARCYARLRSGDRDLSRHLASAWLQAHEPDSARVVLRDALAAEPDVELLMLLGDLEYGDERWAEAREAYGRASTLSPDAARAWLMQGACSLRLDDDAARGALERAAGFEETAGQAERLIRFLDERARGGS